MEVVAVLVFAAAFVLGGLIGVVFSGAGRARVERDEALRSLHRANAELKRRRGRLG